MNVAITGANGFIGTRLQERLLAAGHGIQVVPRSQLDRPPESDAIVHLAGEPVSQRWSRAAKQRIYESRVQGTRRLVAALSSQAQRPAVLVCASAVGYYGSRGDEILTESSGPGDDFLARVVIGWEEAAHTAERAGMRVVCIRLGVVLGKGGALAAMLPLFRLGVGGRLGTGHQWMPWVHIDDAVSLTMLALKASAIRGAVNATAPYPVTNEEFTRRLGAALHRPAILPVPALVLKLALGEMSNAVLASQRVIPAAAKSAGFNFDYPELPAALRNVLSTE